MLRPGAFTITDRAMEIIQLPKKSKVLEVGCGEGETTERLEKHYGFDVSAIDISMEMVRIAKERGLAANIFLGDGEFLDDFSSHTFDGVVMECVLSLINLPDEALHEVYCVLKETGKLFISDLYLKNPEPGLLRSLDIEAHRLATKPHEESSCSDDCADDHKKRLVNFRYQGVLLLEPLQRALEDMGFRMIIVEDYSKELGNYLAESILKGQKNPATQSLPKDTGYFLLVAEKARKDNANE
jgi:ubiquinone/menaquinone biosynthesis C-methylase UbiE